MAKTLLQLVNEILKRASIINGDSGVLTTLTDSGRQIFIDVAVQCVNEAIDDLYEAAEKPKPNALGEDTIVLATSTRNYTLNASLNELLYPMLDETNGQYITEYPGGYLQMVEDQIYPGSYTGLPEMGTIRPSDGAFYLDRSPTANENGLTYKYRYLKDVSVSAAADTVPFKNVVYRAMVPAITELWNRSQKNSFDGNLYIKSIGRAARYLNQVPLTDSWQPTPSPVGVSPFDE